MVLQMIVSLFWIFGVRLNLIGMGTAIFMENNSFGKKKKKNV